jgi:hypothetical protein
MYSVDPVLESVLLLIALRHPFGFRRVTWISPALFLARFSSSRNPKVSLGFKSKDSRALPEISSWRLVQDLGDDLPEGRHLSRMPIEGSAKGLRPLDRRSPRRTSSDVRDGSAHDLDPTNLLSKARVWVRGMSLPGTIQLILHSTSRSPASGNSVR